MHYIKETETQIKIKRSSDGGDAYVYDKLNMDLDILRNRVVQKLNKLDVIRAALPKRQKEE